MFQRILLSKILESANELARSFSTLSNKYRILIILCLMEKKHATWSDVKHFIETKMGSINPNTLHFHLKTLTEDGYIKRSGGNNKIMYELSSIPEYLRKGILENKPSKIKEKRT